MSEMRRISEETINCGDDRKGCYKLIPTRFVFVFFGFFGFSLIYSYKVVLSVAVVAMVNHDKDSDSNLTDECRNEFFNNTIPSMITTTTIGPPKNSPSADKFDWTDSQTNAVLGAYYYGYILTQIPGGLLAQRLGAKWLFGSCILMTAVLSLLSPIAAKWSYNAFFAVRVGQGLAEGGVFPIMAVMIAKWLPKMERSLGLTMIFTGAQIGTVATMPLAGVLCYTKLLGGPGWPSTFYLLGILGCVWFILWAVLVFECPEKHPYISLEELDCIKKGQGEEVVKKVS